MNTKKSSIWKNSDEEFIKLFNTSESFSDLLRKIKVNVSGGNQVTAKKRAQKLGLDINSLLLKSKCKNINTLLACKKKSKYKIEEIFTNVITNIFNSSEFIEQLTIQCKKKLAESLISESQSVIVRKTQQLKQNPEFNAKMILAISELIDK